MAVPIPPQNPQSTNVLPDNKVEAYKTITEFNKTIISIASAVLAIVVTYLTSQDYVPEWRSLLSPVLLTISIGLSLSAFGKAIPAIQKSEKRVWAIRYSNLAGGIMLAGILCIGFIRKSNGKNAKDIFKEIEKVGNYMDYKLFPENCSKFELIDKEYTMYYEYDSVNVQVEYSLKDDCVIRVRRSIDSPLNPTSVLPKDTLQQPLERKFPSSARRKRTMEISIN